MNLSALGAALLRDTPLRLVGFAYLQIGILYLAPGTAFEALESRAWGFVGPLLLVFAIISIHFRRTGPEAPTRKLYWNYVTVALVLWLAAFVAELKAPAFADQALGKLFVDSIYVSYFFTLVFATEIRPDLEAVLKKRGREEELLRASTVSFVLALLVYCTVIPSQSDPNFYLAGRFSTILFLCLSIFFIARFAFLSGVAVTARWRLVYQLFFASFVISAIFLILKSQAGLASSPLPAAYHGTALDCLALLALLPVIVAARVNSYPFPDHEMLEKREEALAPRIWEPVALYAIAFPLLHLLLDFYGQLRAPSRVVQQGLVIVYFSFFGFLALLHGTWREKKRRLAEEALRESEHRYRQLIESHPDAILIEQDGRFVYVNATGVEKLGVDASGGSSFASIGFPEPSLPSESARGGMPVECSVEAVQGKKTDLEVSYIDMTYRGRPAIQAIARDVTEARRQRAESERIARLASLGQFSAAMAHEIRNPLAVIVMHSFFLTERLSQDDENVQSLTDINAAVERLQKLVNGVQDFVRPGPLHPAEEDLLAVIDSARCEVRRRATLPDITFVEDYHQQDTTVEIDATQMVSAFTHILSNAVHAMPDGGTLTLRTENAEGGRRIGVVVEDTGIGIPEGDLGRIFEPFFTRRKDGIGLGLALVARILDQHGCRYRVESVAGEGTRFFVDFTLAGATGDRGREDPEREALHR